MKPRPSIYDAILVIGGGSVASDGSPVAKIGGTWAQPNLGLSYLLAARHVLEAGERERRVNEVALPAAYLQRHAFEVALKDVIETARVLKTDEDWLNALKADPKARRSKPEEVPFVHAFDQLLALLREALAAISFGEPPKEVVDTVARLRATEGHEPSRLRYLTVRRGERSFPGSVTLRVGETQDLLEHVFERVFAYQGTEVVEENLVTSLAHEGMALDQAILQIVPLDEL